MSRITCRMARLLHIDLFSIKSSTGVCWQALSTIARNSSSWDLVSSICLERPPVLTRDLKPLEQQFQTLQSNVEFECSLKSDHEMRKEQERKFAERLKKGQLEDSELDQTTKATAQDFEDACQDEFANFKLTPRHSEEKKHSINRKLDQNLLLFVKQKIGDKLHWILPQEKRADGETMRQAAERALKTACGDSLKVLFLGNAPWGFYKYKYPLSIRKNGGPEGAKVFFFKAIYQSGNVNNKDLQWLTKEEAASSVPEEYFRSIDQFILHESEQASHSSTK